MTLSLSRYKNHPKVDTFYFHLFLDPDYTCHNIQIYWNIPEIPRYLVFGDPSVLPHWGHPGMS